MFIRFVVGTESENAAWLDGIFVGAITLRDSGVLFSYQSQLLDTIFDWFNEHLPCPPFKEKLGSGEWTPHAVSWFRPEAREPVSRIWDMVAILRDHGTPVRLVRSTWPGSIVYADEFQVVAETPSWR